MGYPKRGVVTTLIQYERSQEQETKRASETIRTRVRVLLSVLAMPHTPTREWKSLI